MKDWKTTVCGILTILGSICTAGIAALHGQTTTAIAALSTGVPVGVGLIKAADSKPADKPAAQ
jgi:hypothetical protein